MVRKDIYAALHDCAPEFVYSRLRAQDCGFGPAVNDGYSLRYGLEKDCTPHDHVAFPHHHVAICQPVHPFFILLSLRVIALRDKPLFAVLKCAGDDKRSLERAIRGHGNFAEYTPIMLVLMLIAEQ